MTIGSSTGAGAAGTSSNGLSSKATDLTDPLQAKDTFLKLMVAQLQNQNPLNPTDPVQFLSQLTEFSMLEQTISMRQDMEAARTSLEQIQKQLSPSAATGTR